MAAARKVTYPKLGGSREAFDARFGAPESVTTLDGGASVAVRYPHPWRGARLDELVVVFDTATRQAVSIELLVGAISPAYCADSAYPDVAEATKDAEAFLPPVAGGEFVMTLDDHPLTIWVLRFA